MDIFLIFLWLFSTFALIMAMVSIRELKESHEKMKDHLDALNYQAKIVRDNLKYIRSMDHIIKSHKELMEENKKLKERAEQIELESPDIWNT